MKELELYDDNRGRLLVYDYEEGFIHYIYIILFLGMEKVLIFPFSMGPSTRANGPRIESKG